MDPKLYLVNVLYVLTLVHLSLSDPFFGAFYNDYYMNIKTSVDFKLMHREDNAKWRNDSLFVNRNNSYFNNRCKVQLDHRDNCYLYLVKNQSTSTIHGPIRIDPKHIDLEIKFDKSNRIMNDPDHKWMDKSDLELPMMYHARCHLMRLTYQIFENYPIRSFAPLNTYLELDSKTASLFPKIEKNDYFMLNIINFFDEINPNNVFDKSILQLFGKMKFVTASIAISNYTIVPIEKFNKT